MRSQQLDTNTLEILETILKNAFRSTSSNRRLGAYTHRFTATRYYKPKYLKLDAVILLRHYDRTASAKLPATVLAQIW